MTKQKQSERAEAIARLLETLKPGDTVHTVLRHVSRSGMLRLVDLYKMTADGPQYLTYNAHLAGVGSGFDRKREGLKMGGCGMDMGFAAVYELGQTLWGEGFGCVGEKCHSNDHRNAHWQNRQGRCAVCGGELGTSNYARANGQNGHMVKVCSQACASGDWVHRSGGYALEQRWL